MLYSLILVLSLSSRDNTAHHEVMIQSGLTQQECVSMMQKMSDQYKTDKSELICRNNKYTLVI